MKSAVSATGDSDVFIKSSCRVCQGAIEFPAHGLGEWVECPHCQGRIQLQKPLPALSRFWRWCFDPRWTLPSPEMLTRFGWKMASAFWRLLGRLARAVPVLAWTMIVVGALCLATALWIYLDHRADARELARQQADMEAAKAEAMQQANEIARDTESRRQQEEFANQLDRDAERIDREYVQRQQQIDKAYEDYMRDSTKFYEDFNQSIENMRQESARQATERNTYYEARHKDIQDSYERERTEINRPRVPVRYVWRYNYATGNWEMTPQYY